MTDVGAGAPRSIMQRLVTLKVNDSGATRGYVGDPPPPGAASCIYSASPSDQLLQDGVRGGLRTRAKSSEFSHMTPTEGGSAYTDSTVDKTDYCTKRSSFNVPGSTPH